MTRISLVLLLFLCSLSINAQQILIRGEVLSFDNQHFAQARTASDADDGLYYRFVHFAQIPTAVERKRLEQLGMTFLNYFSERTYQVAMEKPIVENILTSVGVDGVEEIPVLSKLSQKVKERPIPEWAQVDDHQVIIIVKGYSTTDAYGFGAAFKKINARVNFVARQIAYVHLIVDVNRIEEIATMPQVAFVDWISAPAQKEDSNGRAMHRSNILDSSYPGGRHYDGTGVKVLVRDDGSVGPHIDFKGRVNQLDPTIYGGNDHGDMVAGILVGAGNLFPEFKGMATGADLFVRNYEPTFLDETMDLHLNEGVVVTSSSYSDGCNGGYTATTHTVDDQIFTHPTLIHVFSAGNSGATDCGYGPSGWGNITGGHKQGKNVIATGNLNVDITLNTTSSRGPAYDGRIKPDICAHGNGQMSTDPNNIYNPGGGTSAAAPGAAGVVVQLMQAYKEANDGQEPNTGLIKACLLNTAIDLGKVGPDFKYGWGEINGYRAVKTIEEHHYVTAMVGQGQNSILPIDVPAATVEARFMLYWMDPAAPEGASQALINDLDLKVVTPAGDTILPWILNPTATTSAGLDAPAGHGVDHLNNMEQVAFNAPQAGTYQVLVAGTSVPMGPQLYFVVYDFVDNPMFMAYPNGGEHFSPGESVRVFWDGPIGSTKLEVSLNNGISWTELTQTTAKYYKWLVPNSLTDSGLMRVTHSGLSAQSLASFSIMDRPDNMSLDTVCPNYLHFSWPAIEGATAYDVYLLGDKYMEIVGTSVNNNINLPTANPLEEIWFSVRAKGDNGLLSGRAYAKRYTGGLKNCVAQYELAVVEIMDMPLSDITQCENQSIPIKAKIKNNGAQTLSNVSIKYTKNGGAPTQVAWPVAISPGETLAWEADDALVLAATGEYSLSVTVVQADDEIASNNTLTNSFSVNNIALVSETEFVQDFEGIFPPENWTIIGAVGNYDWAQGASVTGADGMSTTTAWVDNYATDGNGLPLILETQLVNTANLPNFKLNFDYAYAGYGGEYMDTLKILVYDVCDYTKPPIVVFYKGGDDLMTISNYQSSVWHPSSASNWKHESLNINDAGGGMVAVQFINIGHYGNSLFVDNINLSPDVQGVFASETIACVNQSVEFSTDYLGNGVSYHWDFGNGTTANTVGPHNVIYTTIGAKNIELTVNDNGTLDTFDYSIVVALEAMAAYDLAMEGVTGVFTNNSTEAQAYLWDFGDGSSTTIENPVHTFPHAGQYEVCLIAFGACNSDTTCTNFDVLVSDLDVADIFSGVRLTPNPTSGVFFVNNGTKEKIDVDITILDSSGKILWHHAPLRIDANAKYSVDVSNLASGVYWVRLLDKQRVGYAKLVVE